MHAHFHWSQFHTISQRYKFSPQMFSTMSTMCDLSTKLDPSKAWRRMECHMCLPHRRRRTHTVQHFLFPPLLIPLHSRPRALASRLTRSTKAGIAIQQAAISNFDFVCCSVSLSFIRDMCHMLLLLADHHLHVHPQTHHLACRPFLLILDPPTSFPFPKISLPPSISLLFSFS